MRRMNVGRNPRSERVPPDPLLLLKSAWSTRLQAGPGVGRGPGGPPHN
jgi:hypothetical protein